MYRVHIRGAAKKPAGAAKPSSTNATDSPAVPSSSSPPHHVINKTTTTRRPPYRPPQDVDERARIARRRRAAHRRALEVKRAKLVEKEPKTSKPSEDNERLLSEALADLKASAIVDKDSEAEAKTGTPSEPTWSEQHSKTMLAAAAGPQASSSSSSSSFAADENDAVNDDAEAASSFAGDLERTKEQMSGEQKKMLELFSFVQAL